MSEQRDAGEGAEFSSERPQYFDDPAIDQLYSLCLALTSELSVTYDRLDLLERVLAAQGVLPAGALEAFELSEQAQQQRAERRDGYVRRVLQSFAEQRERLLRDAKR